MKGVSDKGEPWDRSWARSFGGRYAEETSLGQDLIWYLSSLDSSLLTVCEYFDSHRRPQPDDMMLMHASIPFI